MADEYGIFNACYTSLHGPYRVGLPRNTMFVTKTKTSMVQIRVLKLNL
jgi:hypothetical protein